MTLDIPHNVMDVELEAQNIKIASITVVVAIMIYAIPALFRKHPNQLPAQKLFSNAIPTTSLKRKVRQVNSERSVVVMNAEKAKSNLMLTTITVMIVTTIYAWIVQLQLQKD